MHEQALLGQLGLQTGQQTLAVFLPGRAGFVLGFIAGNLLGNFLVIGNDAAFLCLIDQQDALTNGMAVSEYAPSGKSAAELLRLWQWVANKLDQTQEIGRRSDAYVPAVAALPQGFHQPSLTGRASLPNRFMDF